MKKLYESCPAIKAIHINFPENMGQQLGYTRWNDQPDDRRRTERAIYGKPDFTVFSGLEELTLDNVYEELPWWRSQIVQLLEKSPGLQKLRLSLAANTLFRYKDKEDCAEFYYNFFDKLCVEYGAVASPLRIRSLHLGNAVLPFKLGRIQLLTDLSVLEDAHIENRKLVSTKSGPMSSGVPACINPTEREWDTTDADDAGYPHFYDDYHAVAFQVFGPVNCPNLRRLTVGHYDEDLDEYLRDTADPVWTRKLALSCVSMHGCDMQPASLLLRNPALHMRMLEIDLSWHLGLSNIDSNLEFFTSSLRSCLGSSAAKLILDRLSHEDHGTLEGLAVYLRVNSALDLVCRDQSPLLAALSQLHNLTQFSIEGLSESQMPGLKFFYNANQSLVKGFSKSERLLRKQGFPWLAELCALKAPRLRYVGVCGTHWRVLREGPTMRVRLEKLEDWEIDSVELFRGCVWKPRLSTEKLYSPIREVLKYWKDFEGSEDSEDGEVELEEDELGGPDEDEDWATHLQGYGVSIASSCGGD